MREVTIASMATILMLTGFVGCASTKPDIAELRSQGGEIRVYEVFGMDCPGCHGGLENLVNEIPGVVTSQANWEQQRLVVAIRPNQEVTDGMIHDAIRQANFTPGERLE